MKILATLLFIFSSSAFAACEWNEVKDSIVEHVRLKYPQYPNPIIDQDLVMKCGDYKDAYVTDIDLYEVPETAPYMEHRAASRYVIVKMKKVANNCSPVSVKDYHSMKDDGAGYYHYYGMCKALERMFENP